MNLLLTSIGKRIELTEHLKKDFRVIGVDASAENPGKYFADAFYLVPRCREKGYVEALLSVCEKEAVSLLVPLYEPEFAVLDSARERFRRAGVKLVLSDGPVLDICNDKRRTAAFFDKYGIPAPATFSGEEVRRFLTEEKAEYPLILKPSDGMGSEGIFFAKNRRELEFFCGYAENALVQECAGGREYTVDVLCDFYGEPVYVVPRIRLEVRSGEVTKSRVDLQERIIEETRRLLSALNREGCVCGPMTIQCFWAEEEEKLKFIEINPRFGGGVPLSFAAGADYAAALRRMGESYAAQAGSGSSGGREQPDLTDFQKREIRELTMLRYTRAVYE